MGGTTDHRVRRVRLVRTAGHRRDSAGAGGRAPEGASAGRGRRRDRRRGRTDPEDPAAGTGPPGPLVGVAETRHLVAYQGSLFWTGAAGLQRLGPDESAPATVSADAGR